MALLRFLMLLSLAVWLGGVIFFPVVAQTAFSVLPSPSLAGLVVGHSLMILHWMGLGAGVVFLVCSLSYSRVNTGDLRVLSWPNILVLLMLGLTLISQFGVIPKMNSLRASMPGEIDAVARDFPARVQFNALHVWSTRIEGTVMLLGLCVVFSLARSWQERA